MSRDLSDDRSIGIFMLRDRSTMTANPGGCCSSGMQAAQGGKLANRSDTSWMRVRRWRPFSISAEKSRATAGAWQLRSPKRGRISRSQAVRNSWPINSISSAKTAHNIPLIKRTLIVTPRHVRHGRKPIASFRFAAAACSLQAAKDVARSGQNFSRMVFLIARKCLFRVRSSIGGGTQPSLLIGVFARKCLWNTSPRGKIRSG